MADLHDAEKESRWTHLFKFSNPIQHSKEYLEFAKAIDLPPLTNTQRKFAEWLLRPENAAQLGKIGDLESVFKAVRRHIKTRKHEPSQPV